CRSPRRGAPPPGPPSGGGIRGDSTFAAAPATSSAKLNRGQEPMFDLSGKTALVTGASGGIRGALAKALARQGARGALSGTRVEALQQVQAELGGEHPIPPCNLADAGAVDALVGQAEQALGGRLDILVANAGITKDGLMLRMKDED